MDPLLKEETGKREGAEVAREGARGYFIYTA